MANKMISVGRLATGLGALTRPLRATGVPGTAFSTSSATERYHKDKVANRYLRRFGYNDKVVNWGPLPRISNDSPRVSQKPAFTVQNPWAPSEALYGQNDYIDILGSDELGVTDTHYHMPRWLKGQRFRVPMQAVLAKNKMLSGSGFSMNHPEEYRKMKANLGRYYTWQRKHLDFRKWTNYPSKIKYGPVPDSYKTNYPF